MTRRTIGECTSLLLGWRLLLGGVGVLLLPAVQPARAQAAAPVAPPGPKEDEPWVVMAPTKLSSAGGATFTIEPDRAVLVTGVSAEKDVYTLEFETDVRAITAFRLDALADAGLPQQGPGRATNGNFVLSEMKVEAAPKSSRRFRPVPLQNASADFIEGSRSARMVHDGVEEVGGNGWAVHGAVGRNHHLVAETRKEVSFEGTVVVRVELVFNWGSQHTLGHLRLSATNRPQPVTADLPKDTEGAQKFQERINRAIDRGCDYLMSVQQIDGSWHHEQQTYRNGATGLATYALLKSAVPKSHPSIVRAVEFMRGVAPRETYSLGCQLMALGALDDPDLLPWMKELTDTLLSFQKNGFNYPWGNVDLSNTQYGVLGLRAAALQGVKVPPDAFERAAQQVIQFQQDLGQGAYGAVGFFYNPGHAPTGSITAAGAGILAICDEQLKGRSKAGNYLAAAKGGIEWLGQNWAVDMNPKESHDRWNTYYLYGIERVGSLLELAEIGRHPWYKEGARHLVERQGGKGEWGSAYGDQVINTCFALLFLNRATAVASGISRSRVKIYGSDDPREAISLRASGDTPLTLWIASFGEAELAAYEWPKEQERGLRVKKVEYVASGLAEGGDEAVLATIDRDPGQPCGHDRFGAQWSFRLPGKYTLVARATIQAPPEEEGMAPDEVVIESDPLEVKIEEALDPELVAYAKDPARNLLAGQKVVANASSQKDDGCAAQFAVDRLQCRGWYAAATDANPTLTLELERPVRTTTVLVTPVTDGEPWVCRIRRLALTVNGKGPALEVEAPAGVALRKIKLRFPQPQIVRKLEFRILARDPAAEGKAIGINEVELLADKPGEKERP